MINPFTHRKILKKGRAGKAVITAFTMPERGSSTQNLPITLEVHVEGRSPYMVEDQWMVSSKDSLGFGIEVPVKVDVDDPQKVAIDWKAAREVRAAEKGSRAAQLAAQPVVGSSWPPAAGGGAPVVDARNDPELRAKLEGVVGHSLEPGTEQTIDTSGDPALAARIMQVVSEHAASQAAGGGSSGPGEDTISKLERLSRLRDAGALTDEEFEEQKRALLGGT